MNNSKPLSGRKILITRSKSRAGELSRLLVELGASCLELPVIEMVPPSDWTPLDQALDRLDTYHWIAFTSVHGVEAFFDRVANKKIDIKHYLGSLHFAAVGPGTVAALNEKGIQVTVVPETSGAQSLSEKLGSFLTPANNKILFPCGSLARTILVDRLQNLGANVDVVIAYQTRPARSDPAEARQLMQSGEIDWITFTSSSTVQNFFALLPDAIDSIATNRIFIASIGPQTSDTLREFGLEPTVESSLHNLASLVESMVDHHLGEKQESSNTRLFNRAQQVLVGGVNSPVRAFQAVQGTPLFIQEARGAKIRDADGREYLDFVDSWGPMILGHAHSRVVKAIQRAAEQGSSFGAPTEREIELAEMVCERVPSVEMLRMVNSGTEAAMTAIRLARAYTQRDKILKFDGAYHGHTDALLLQAGSGATTLGSPDSPGVPAAAIQDTLSACYNDLDSVEEVIKKYPGQIAAIFVEPVAGNMGVVPPEPGFLEGLREICHRENILLVFDEVMTGFRLARGGAQERFQIKADLTLFGKIIGGGLPVGAVGGKREIMQNLAPAGPVYQSGTLSGNPLAMAAGLETLKVLDEEGVYQSLEQKSRLMYCAVQTLIQQNNYPLSWQSVGSMGCLFFQPDIVRNYRDAKRSNTQQYAAFFHAMLKRGVYLAPSQFEAVFLSLAHTEQDIETTTRAMKESLDEVFCKRDRL